MVAVIGCIIHEHDLVIVIIAALVCAAGSWATVRLFQRATNAVSAEKSAWLILAALISGAAIWCTHFIAILGLDRGVPVGFDPVMTIISLLVAIAGSACGFAVAAGMSGRFAPLVGGAIVGAAISGMHYLGMLAYRVQGIVTWDKSELLASIAFATIFSTLALYLSKSRNEANAKFCAAGFFFFAIVSLHFLGVAAFKIQPILIEGEFSNPQALRMLAIAVAGVALPVVGAGLSAHLIDRLARADASKALRNMSNGLIMVAANGEIQLFNDRLFEMLRLTNDDLHIGMPITRFLRRMSIREQWNPGQMQQIRSEIRSWIGGQSAVRLEYRCVSGMCVSVSCQIMQDGGAVLTFDDVSEAREVQRQIAHMAFHDALTGLPNRRSFAEKIASLSASGPFSVLMLDLDHFKSVNDTLGHDIGDALLVNVAHRLKGFCGPEDTLFRLGGDELAVLGKQEDGGARGMAGRMVESFAHPFQIGDHAISIGLSAGVAIADKGTEPVFAQRMADRALYKAKEAGRGRVDVYRRGMIEEGIYSRRIERDLMPALTAGQFELHFQPLYALPDRTLVGFEALIRWRHPELGAISPAEFIPIAERSGAIVEIGQWVINEACRQAATWNGNLYVSINVSPKQLRFADTVHHLKAALARCNLAPQQIEIELTETAIVENNLQIAEVLSSLRSLGARVAMDDFGTGYSSLVHLCEFELDRIKIDRSFISACHHDPHAAAIVRAITAMAKEMAVETTGEGVENEDQLACLVEYGCGTAQGYLLGRPVTAAEALGIAGSATELARADISEPVAQCNLAILKPGRAA